MNIWSNTIVHYRSSPSVRRFKPLLCLFSTQSFVTRSSELNPNKPNLETASKPISLTQSEEKQTTWYKNRSEGYSASEPKGKFIFKTKPRDYRLRGGVKYKKRSHSLSAASQKMSELPGRLLNPMVWVDCEMTGLDPNKDKIIQIVCYITNWDLSLMQEKGFEHVIWRSPELLNSMDEWCTKTHTESGLVERVKASKTNARKAAFHMLDYIKRFIPEKNVGLLCGNSVHADKLFMKDEFKIVLDHLHYRIGDVSSIKEFALRWSSPDILQNVPKKKYTHEARQDILESIEEARYWANAIFRNSSMPRIPLANDAVNLERRRQDEANLSQEKENKQAIDIYLK